MIVAEAFDAAWWKEQAVIWFVFSLLVSLLLFGLQQRRNRRERSRYEGWRLEMVGFGDPPQTLYWEDVRRWLASSREMWVMVKGTASGVCTLTPRTIDEPLKRGWVLVDRLARCIVVNFEQVPPEHLEGGKFKPGHRPAR